MASVINKIELTKEEKDILCKARDILKDISEGMEYGSVQDYENSEYVTNILDIYFEY